MKLFFVLAAVTVAQAAKLDRVYLPPNARASAGSGNFLQAPFQASSNQAPNAYSSAATYNSNTYAQNAYPGFEARNERTQAARERNAAILRQDNSNDGETYSYAYETENGIYAEESGVATNGVQAQGGYSYTGDDGKVYSVRYTADENGFVPQGDHLPTPPPIPEEIMRALEKNAREEAAGIYDDGSYTEAKYDAASNTQQQYYNTNAQPINYNEDSIVTNSASLRNANGFNKNYAIANSASLRNGNGFNRNSVIANSASLRNGNGFNRNSIIANSASLHNGNGFNRNSVEKTYLPPFSRGNGNFNAKTGYNY